MVADKLNSIWQKILSRIPPEAVVAITTSAAVFYLAAGPLGVLLFSSFRYAKAMLPFESTSFYTMSNYDTVFTSDLTYRMLLNTLVIVVVALAIGLTLAISFAWFAERTNAPHRRVLITMVLASLGVPPIVEAMAWILLANPVNGVLNVALRDMFGLATNNGPLNIYSLVGMGFVIGIKMMPSMYIMLVGVIARMDPGLEEASLTSGATYFTTFRRITAQLMRPATLAVVIFFTVAILELFEIPGLLGMPRGIFTFATLIFSVTHPPVGMANYGLGSGYAVFNLIIAGGFIYAYYLQVRKENRFAVVTGKAYRPRPVELRKRWCYIFYAAIALYILLAVIAPFWVLLSASLGILYTPFSFGLATLQYYRDAFALPDLWRSTWNTLVISSVAATVCMLIALVTSWLAIRGKYRGSTLPSNLTFLVHAVPSIVIGLAFIIIYTRIPIPIYGTIWIIALAYVTRYMGFSVRLLYSPYLQLHSELEEASGTCGVGWLSTMRHIVMPILWPSFIKGWLWVFITCIRDVGLALMLFVVSNDTIGIRLWQIWGTGRHFEWGAALAMPLLVFSIFLSFFIARPSLKGGEVI